MEYTTMYLTLCNKPKAWQERIFYEDKLILEREREKWEERIKEEAVKI